MINIECTVIGAVWSVHLGYLICSILLQYCIPGAIGISPFNKLLLDMDIEYRHGHKTPSFEGKKRHQKLKYPWLKLQLARANWPPTRVQEYQWYYEIGGCRLMPVTSPISWISGTAQSSSDLQGHQCAMCVMYSTVHTYIHIYSRYLLRYLHISQDTWVLSWDNAYKLTFCEGSPVSNNTMGSDIVGDFL